MKHLKMLVVSVAGAAALMAFAAGLASATVLYNGATKLSVGSTIDLSVLSGTKVKLTNTAETETLDECSVSTTKGKTVNAGSTTETVRVNRETLSWGTCTVPTTTTLLGSTEIHWIPGTTNGTVTSSSETKLSINTIFFGICVYRAEAGRHEGLWTGAVRIMDLNEIVSKGEGSEAVCPATARLIGSYKITEPSELQVEES